MLIDSSAIVKYLSKEPGWHDTARYINEAYTIPLALVEVGNALSRKLRKNEMSKDTAAELLGLYSKSAVLVDQNSRIDLAFKISTDENITMYDSLFLAVALDNGHDLVSCDEKQLKVAEKLGIKTFKC